MTLKVLLKDPGKRAVPIEVENTAEAMAELIGGFIGEMEFRRGGCYMLVCDRFAAKKHLNANFWNYGKGAAALGRVLVTRINEEGRNVDITESDITAFTEVLPELMPKTWGDLEEEGKTDEKPEGKE